MYLNIPTSKNSMLKLHSCLSNGKYSKSIRHFLVVSTLKLLSAEIDLVLLTLNKIRLVLLNTSKVLRENSGDQIIL